MKIAYINISTNNPRDMITIRGLQENGVFVLEITDCTPGWKKFCHIGRRLLSERDNYDLIVVGYAGSILVPLARVISRKKVVYNALATFFDSMIVSRGKGKIFSIQTIRYYIIDYLAFHLAHKIFIECEAQKNLIKKIFHVNPHKISVQFVGTNELDFYLDPTVKKLDKFTVLFRGKFLPEAGADVVLKAAKLLEGTNIDFRIIGNGLLEKEIRQLSDQLKCTNIELITKYLAVEKLREKMLECHLSLGQMADHSRVHTTIPHKAFESLIIKLPYLTGRNQGVLEILKEEETCLCVRPGDHEDLAEKILALKNQPELLEKIASAGFKLYQDYFTTKKLGEKVLKELKA